jgi:4-hydroxy-tetrahydrodipicolinate synthase
MFKGSLTALITPFRNGKLDEKAYRHLIEWQIESGTDALVAAATTGESPTLSHTEHRRMVELCIETAAGRLPVIASTGSNSTAEAVAFAQHAKKAGAAAQLSVTPYYNKPTQEGLYNHFKAINDATDLPILLYNIPGRSIVDISVETMARLAKLPNIVGVKDATLDLARPMLTRIACGADFCQLSGEDATMLAQLAMGGHGCISVTANIAPRLCADMHRAWSDGDVARAQEINELLMPLHTALFCETNPAPVKYAASLLGLCTAEVRLPICQISIASKRIVEEAMIGVGLIEKGKIAKAG